MENSYVSALAALAGATIGGLTSFITSWLTQRTQLRHALREAESTELKQLYQTFIAAATRLLVEAHRTKTDDIDDVAGLLEIHGMIGRMRLISSQPVIDAAMQVEKTIIDVYLGPNRTIREIIEIARDEESGSSPVFTFSAACRIDLFERATKPR